MVTFRFRYKFYPRILVLVVFYISYSVYLHLVIYTLFNCTFLKTSHRSKLIKSNLKFDLWDVSAF